MAPWVAVSLLGSATAAEPAELPEGFALDDVPLSALLEMSLDEYLAAGFLVAAREALTLRESPSVVTVLSHDEIVSTGARDLIDVLNLAAGFSPLIDSESNFNVGFRGIINEGKVLLTIDGQPMNEVFYNSLRLVPRYPIDQIERIEIVRGPGSVIYGGQAEMGVINIVTRGPSTQDGVAFAATGGTFEGDGRRIDLSASYADRFEKLGVLSTSIALYLGSASHSAFRYTDFAGDSYVLADRNSRYEPLFVNIGASFHGLNLRLIHDGFHGFHRDVFSDSEPTAYELQDRGYYAQLDYGWELSRRLTLTPLVRYQQQQPWRVADPSSSAHFDKTADVSFGSLSAAWDPIDALDVLIGGEGSLTRGWLNSEAFTGLQSPLAGGDRLQFHHFGAFAQVVSVSVIGNITAGARFEHHSEVGASFVPRLAYTRIFGNFHAKLMGSGAFRAPSIENVSLATEPGQTRPEKTRALEAEAGYQLNKFAWLVVNVFDVTIDDPIV